MERGISRDGCVSTRALGVSKSGYADSQAGYSTSGGPRMTTRSSNTIHLMTVYNVQLHAGRNIKTTKEQKMWFVGLLQH